MQCVYAADRHEKGAAPPGTAPCRPSASTDQPKLRAKGVDWTARDSVAWGEVVTV